MDERDHALNDLAARQHGVVSIDQIAELGLSRSAWRHRLARDAWTMLSPRVAARTGAPDHEHRAALAAVLDVGPHALMGWESGAHLWGVPGFRLAPHHVMEVRDHAPRRSSLAIVHRPLHGPAPFAAVLHGIPVVRPALLLLQLAPRVHPDRLGRILDNLWSRRLLSGPSVRSQLDPLMHRGRAGTAVLRTLLDERGDDYIPPASGLEARFARILSDAGLPTMRSQVDVGDGERWCARVDFLDPELPLIIEIDGDAYHRALSDIRADAEREARLVAAGYTVKRFDEHDVWYEPQSVLAEVRAVRSELRRQRRATA